MDTKNSRNVVITVRHFYEPSEKLKFCARITVAIPADEDGKIVALYQSDEKEVLGRILSEYWGKTCGRSSSATHTVKSGEGWAALEVAVDAEIENAKQALRSVVDKNRAAIAQMPRDRAIELVF